MNNISKNESMLQKNLTKCKQIKFFLEFYLNFNEIIFVLCNNLVIIPEKNKNLMLSSVEIPLIKI